MSIRKNSKWFLNKNISKASKRHEKPNVSNDRELLDSYVVHGSFMH